MLDKPEDAGKFREGDVRITETPFIPVSHGLVKSEMAKVVQFLREGPKLIRNPIEMAALAHIAFVRKDTNNKDDSN